MDLLQNLFKKKSGGLTPTPSGGRRKKSRSRRMRGGKGSGAGTVKGFFGGKGTALGFSSLQGGRRRHGTRKRGKGRRRR
jgi:hypothetical protein